jgi:hypothetical protein
MLLMGQSTDNNTNIPRRVVFFEKESKVNANRFLGFEAYAHIIWAFERRIAHLKQERKTENDHALMKICGKKTFNYGALKLNEQEVQFGYKIYGSKPEDGYPLWISLHGGGETLPEENETQWLNQLLIDDNYFESSKMEGINVAPRAPTDTWDMWFRPNVDQLLKRLIENFIIKYRINLK